MADLEGKNEHYKRQGDYRRKYKTDEERDRAYAEKRRIASRKYAERKREEFNNMKEQIIKLEEENERLTQELNNAMRKISELNK